MIFLVVCCIIDLVITSQCSEIREVHKYVQSSQRDTKKYCSKIGSCDPGTHVACMYSSGQNSMGQKCNSNAKPIKLTKGMETLILSSVNGIRKRLSEGMETGANQENLPRAYGMINIQWDQELADLAQLWVNQCEEGHDKCRSTAMFPNVAQTHYSFINTCTKRRCAVRDSWVYNLTVNVLEKIIVTSIDYWRRGKERVTRETILRADKIVEYLQMIHGQNTHLGCGMAAYTSNSYKNKTQNPRLLVIKLVCNWSHQLKPNSMVYDIDPPQGRSGGRSKNCGCYSGQTEGDGCLCTLRSTNITKVKNPAGMEWDSRLSTVVVMPVFTFQHDAHDIPLSRITNLTANYFNNDVIPTRKLFYNDSPLAQEAPRMTSLRVPPPPMTGRNIMFESVPKQEINSPNMRNVNARDISRIKELVQEYLVSEKHNLRSQVMPMDSFDTSQRSTVDTSRITPVDVDRPIRYDYTSYFENTMPRARRVSYGMQDNYHHTPDIKNMDKNDLYQLLNTLLEILYHGNINDLFAKIHDAHVDEEDYRSLIRISKPIKDINSIDNLEHYEDEARGDENIYSDIDNGRRMEASSEIVWPSIRKQNPLKHTAYDNNYDYYTNDYDYENEKLIRDIERDIMQANLDKDGKYLI